MGIRSCGLPAVSFTRTRGAGRVVPDRTGNSAINGWSGLMIVKMVILLGACRYR